MKGGSIILSNAAKKHNKINSVLKLFIAFLVVSLTECEEFSFVFMSFSLIIISISVTKAWSCLPYDRCIATF